MSCLYTITALAAVRCKSVVLYDGSWYAITSDKFFSLRCLQMIWAVSIVIALPPVLGIGEFVVDVGMIRYGSNPSCKSNGIIQYKIKHGILEC